MRDIIVIDAVIKRRNDRGMIIFPIGNADARERPHRRIAPLSGNYERRADHCAIIKRHLRARAIALDNAGLRRNMERDIFRGENAFAQRSAQHPVFEHDAKRLIIGRSRKIKRAFLQAVTHFNRVDRAAMRLERGTNADGIEHPETGTRNRAGAAIKADRKRILRGHRINHGGAKPIMIKRNRQRLPDEAAAKNDDICVLHGGSLAGEGAVGKMG